jgi:DNA-directed RNA polymerase delta subunit
LKKEEKPLHFEDIAKKIGRMGIDSKPAHVQTVHNELIKDDRFVLVGRGIYALSEHGYEGGTVKQVIAKILNNEGPLRPEEVVKLVNQKKILKKNTILLNLQNKKNFKKLDDGRYHIKEA